MTETKTTEKFPALDTESQVDKFVREVSDTIHDPCGMAAGIKLGLNEMGLIRQIDVEPLGQGWKVHVLLRLTSPGCEYFFAFRDNLEEKTARHPQIESIEVEWDPTLDWTPSDLTEEARKRWQERQGQIWGRPGAVLMLEPR